MSKDKTFEELWAEAVKKIPRHDWDDPKQSDDKRRAEYEKRFDRIILPPPYPDDPKEGADVFPVNLLFRFGVGDCRGARRGALRLGCTGACAYTRPSRL